LKGKGFRCYQGRVHKSPLLKLRKRYAISMDQLSSTFALLMPFSNTRECLGVKHCGEPRYSVRYWRSYPSHPISTETGTISQKPIYGKDLRFFAIVRAKGVLEVENWEFMVNCELLIAL